MLIPLFTFETLKMMFIVFIKFKSLNHFKLYSIIVKEYPIFSNFGSLIIVSFRSTNICLFLENTLFLQIFFFRLSASSQQ